MQTETLSLKDRVKDHAPKVNDFTLIPKGQHQAKVVEAVHVEASERAKEHVKLVYQTALGRVWQTIHFEGSTPDKTETCLGMIHGLLEALEIDEVAQAIDKNVLIRVSHRPPYNGVVKAQATALRVLAEGEVSLVDNTEADVPDF